MLHVRGQPGDLVALLDELVAQGGVAAAVADVPLARRHDLQRLVALLEEVRHPLGGLGLAVEVAGLTQHGHHLLAGGEDGLAGQALVRLVGPGQPFGGLAGQATVAADDGADGKLQLAPPGDVGEVTEGAAHGDARTLVHLGGRVRHDGHLDAEDRRGHGGAEQRLVALVVGVGDECHDRGDQLGTGGLDVDGAAVGGVVGHAVVRAGVVTRLELGLGHGGLEGDVPEGRCLLEVGLAPGEVAQERALADRLGLLADGRVVLLPVHREAQRAPQLLEDLLVLLDELLAQGDEVRSADRDLLLGVRLGRRGEVGVVGQRGVATHAVVVLHAPLGRQPVVVPTHRVEHGLPAHPLEAGDQVGVGVGEDVADVQAAAHGRRRGVDGVDVLARLGAVEGVGVLLLPPLRPRGLEALQRRLVRYDDGTLGRARRFGGLQRGLGHAENPMSRPRGCRNQFDTRLSRTRCSTFERRKPRGPGSA